MKHRTVADVMTRDVLKGRPAMPLKELARVLAEHGVSALPVLDPDDRLIGVVSESDLLAAGTRPRRLLRWWSRDRGRRGTVGAVMSRSPAVIGPDATLAEAARRMADRGVKRLPVVDEHGALVGVVSRSDLVKVFLRSDDEIRDEIVGEVLVHLLWVERVDESRRRLAEEAAAAPSRHPPRQSPRKSDMNEAERWTVVEAVTHVPAQLTR